MAGMKIEGMTLRDYFTAMFLQGLAAHDLWDDEQMHMLADSAYAAADAMLERRREDDII